MESELARLSTFAKWPSDAEVVRVLALARQGFYYSGNGGGVICSACHVTLDGWKWKESPVERHRQVSPGCKFVINGATSQMGLHSGHNYTSNSHKGILSTDSIAVSNPHASETYSPTQAVAQLLPEKSVELVKDIQSKELPKYQKYSNLTRGIELFRRGNIPQGQTAENLAEVGSFYVGPGDKVRCFQCGGNLRDLEPCDNPWKEHRRWYKDRAHLKTVRSSWEPKHRNVGITTTDSVAFRIDPREVKARMDTPMAKAILNMGYENSLVSQVIENQLTTTGDGFPSAEALLNAIFALDDPHSTTPPHAGHLITHAASTTTDSSIATECNNKLSPESTSSIGMMEAETSVRGLANQRPAYKSYLAKSGSKLYVARDMKNEHGIEDSETSLDDPSDSIDVERGSTLEVPRQICQWNPKRKSPKLFMTAPEANNVPEPGVTHFVPRLEEARKEQSIKRESGIADGPRRPTRSPQFCLKSTSSLCGYPKKAKPSLPDRGRKTKKVVLEEPTAGASPINWAQIGTEVECLIRLCKTTSAIRSFEELYEICRKECPDLEPVLVMKITAAHFPMRRSTSGMDTIAKTVSESTNTKVHTSVEVVGEDAGSEAVRLIADADYDDSSSDDGGKFKQEDSLVQKDVYLSDYGDLSMMVICSSSDDD